VPTFLVLTKIRRRPVGAKKTSSGSWIGETFNGNAHMMLVSHAPLCWELVLQLCEWVPNFGTIVYVRMHLYHPYMPAENR
jgi:hypothetical protein